MDYTYILSCSDGSLYIGWTNHLEQRLKDHNAGKAGAKYTRSRRPVEIIYYEGYSSMQEAMHREAELKKMTRKQKLDLIQSWQG